MPELDLMVPPSSKPTRKNINSIFFSSLPLHVVLEGPSSFFRVSDAAHRRTQTTQRRVEYNSDAPEAAALAHAS
jgi:hypothetical protein